jgi:hypothetical protein
MLSLGISTDESFVLVVELGDFLRKFRPVEVVGVDENGTDFNPVGFLFNVS